MRKYILYLILLYSLTISACPICHTQLGKAVRSSILNNNFLFVINTILFIFIFFILLGVSCSYFFIKRNSRGKNLGEKKFSLRLQNDRCLLIAGMLLGGGIVGFIDGILFHQILQAHNMIANLLPVNTLINAEINMFWDGIFHLFTLIIITVGIFLLWKALNNSIQKYPPSVFLGSIILGGGLFNLIEGIIDHQYLQLHHVLQKASGNIQFYSDAIFMIIAFLLIGIGLSLIKRNLHSLP